MIRTRYAPSPTGMMHVGNLRTAIFEYLIARGNNGKFILRIEDTDQERKVEGAVTFIYDTLKLCGIDPDEGPNNPGEYGPYVQSERLSIYQEYAMKLVEMGKAYYCFCDENSLNEQRKKAEEASVAFLYDGRCQKISLEEAQKRVDSGEKYVIRQKMPKDGLATFEDIVYGHIEVENKILEDQILLKSDGYPTYNFANVVDDHLMGITHIVRGNEYIMATPKYNHLYESFGWNIPAYIHVPMVLGEDGTKLSKRNGDASFMDLYNDGYLSQAIVNYLVLLGWSPIDTTEIFSMEELTKVFDPKRIGKSPAVFDINKLRWMNGQYIKKMNLEDYQDFILPFMEQDKIINKKDKEWLKKLGDIYKDHISYGKEIVDLASLFFKEEIDFDSECKAFMESDGSIKTTLKTFKEEIESIVDWNVDNIKQAINNTKEKASVNGKLLYMPIRIKVSGQMHGPELPDTIYLLGKETVLKRIN